MTEPFCQWVVEDSFPAGRPAWEKFGVTMVADVRPFEEMKLRLLNGSHSAIAYLGLLSGHATVAEAFADPAIRGFVERLVARGHSDAAGRRRPRSARLYVSSWPGATTTPRSPTRPGRSPMTAARNCRSASSPRRWSAWPTARRPASGAGRRGMDSRLRGARRDLACRAFHRSTRRAARHAFRLAASRARVGRRIFGLAGFAAGDGERERLVALVAAHLRSARKGVAAALAAGAIEG